MTSTTDRGADDGHGTGPDPDGDTVTVVHVPERRRYELRDGGTVIGAAHYRLRPGQVVFTHTVVRDEHGGRGLGALLARRALTDVRDSHLRIVAQCPFIAAYLRRDHDFDDVVDPDPDQPGPDHVAG